MNASTMPYNGSSVNVRFIVKADICCSERMYKKKVSMVHTQLSTTSQSQSAVLGIKLPDDHCSNKGNNNVNPIKPPESWYNVICCGVY